LSNINPALAFPATPRRPAVKKAEPGPVNVWELFAYALLLAMYLVAIAVIGDQGTFVINLAGPTAMGVILVLGAVPGVIRDIDLIWTPLFWFRIATVVYFSFGNVVTYFLNPTSQRQIESFFAQYADFITKLNAVTTLGVLVVLTTVFLVDRFQRSHARTAKGAQFSGHPIMQPKRLYQAGMTFLIIGGAVKLFYTIPSGLGGGVEGQPLLGSLGSLALLADVGVYLIAVWAWNFRPGLLVLPITLTVFEVVVGFLEFSKTEVIFAIMVFAMAWLSKGVSVTRVVVTGLVIVVVFGFMAPYVGQGRDEIARRYQNIGGAGVAERIEIADEDFSTPNRRDNADEAGLMRFSYVNGSALALSLYDTGNPGGTLATLPAAFVPRFLWPDKPDMTAIGREFNYIADGNDQSAASPGWFAESYWDYGWAGVVLIMIPAGIILQLWSTFTLSILRTGNWFYFPLCMLGMKTGVTVDGFVVPVLFATTILAIVAYWLTRAGLEIYERAGVHGAPERVTQI